MTHETDSLARIFAKEGQERLAEILEARGGSSGGALAYGLQSKDGKQLAGNLGAPATDPGAPRAGWRELKETQNHEAPEEKPETLRALVTPLADGSTLIVGDEQDRVPGRGVAAAGHRRFSGIGRVGQMTMAGNPTTGSSLNVAMVSSVM